MALPTMVAGWNTSSRETGNYSTFKYIIIMDQEELTTINDVFSALSNDNNENANNYDIIVRNQTSGNAMKVPVSVLKTVLYNYLTSNAVASALASVLGAQDNNGWSVVASHGSGESIFRLETVIGTTARSYVYTIEGCGTNVQHCIDCRVHFALSGSIAEGKKGDYHTISDSNFKVHFLRKYLYFSLMGNTAIRIISTIPMNLEEVNALPEGATQIVLT